MTIWIIAVLVQIATTIVLSLQFVKTRPQSAQTANNPFFSIVIAAHNELENLKVLMPKLLTQHYETFEIIIALDRSSDQSEKYIEELADPRVKAISLNEPPGCWNSKKWALKSAIDQAMGDWLVFTDADCHPASDLWLDSIGQAIQPETEIVIGYSPYENRSGFLGDFIQYEAFLTAFNYLSLALLKKPYMAVGRNMAIKASLHRQVGGYESIKSINGGDDDLFIQSNANGYNTVVNYGRESLVFTYPKRSWRDYLNQKTRHLSVGPNYSTNDILLHGVFNFSLLAFWVLIPWISTEIVLPIIFFYLSIKWIGYRFAASKMGAAFNYIWLPLVDFLYALIIPIIAIRSKLVKDIQWKKN